MEGENLGTDLDRSVSYFLLYLFLQEKCLKSPLNPPRERTSSAVHFHMDRWTVRVRVRLFSASSSNIKRAPIVQPTNHARLCCNGLLHSLYCNFSNWMGINTSFTSFNHSKPDLQRKWKNQTKFVSIWFYRKGVTEVPIISTPIWSSPNPSTVQSP